MDDTFKDLHFPKAGIDLSQAFWRQPNRPVSQLALLPGQHFPTLVYARTTPLAVNVRGFEPGLQRNRGGARPGLVKFISLLVRFQRSAPILWIIQELTPIVTVGYTPSGGSGVPSSQSGRIVSVVAVVAGHVYVAVSGDSIWTDALSLTGENPALNLTGVIFSAANNQKLWFADGTNYVYYDPSTGLTGGAAQGTVFPWTVGIYQAGDTGGAVGTPKGILPVDDLGNTPRHICTWRGRTVLSGLINDPQNWFMSAVGDPQNFDYSPLSTTPTQAIAGNNAPQGLIGDVITSLCPYTDDVLIFFGDHTIYMMRGDPLAGGQIDLISDAIGGTWGICWCKDPYGTVYFMSNKCGIYTLVPGQAPVRISQQIEQLLGDVDTGNNSIRLVWNDRYQGVHVFITPLEAPLPATHFFFEQRTGAWWTDQFANPNHNPVTCCTFDGNTPGDRAVLIGSWDGYVRTISPTAPDDDGTPIQSAVIIGPILTENLDDMLLKDIQAILGQSSGPVTYSVFVGPTAEAALASTPVVTGTWQVSPDDAGRNLTNLIRRAGHAIYVQLSSSSQWALEQIRLRIATMGKVRRRGK